MQAGRLRMAGAGTAAFLVFFIACRTFGMVMNGKEKVCDSFDPNRSSGTMEDMIRCSWTIVIVMGKTDNRYR